MNPALNLLAGALLVGLAWGILGSARIVAQVRYQPSLKPSDLGFPAEALFLTTSDGLRLAAWFVRHAQPTGLLLMLHGYGASKEDLLDIARALHEQGSFHLLLLDSRGHGASEGSTISFGHKEILDVRAALEFASSHPECQGLPIGCYGVSMGGAVALLAAAQWEIIQAVVTDSTYADLPSTIARIQRLTYHIPRIPLGQLAIWGAQLRLGCRVRNLSPAAVVGRVSPRPVLLIHGTQDPTTPKEEAVALYDAAKEPKELWLIEGAEHVAGFYQHPQEYTRRITGFFQRAFARAT